MLHSLKRMHRNGLVHGCPTNQWWDEQHRQFNPFTASKPPIDAWAKDEFMCSYSSKIDFADASFATDAITLIFTLHQLMEQANTFENWVMLVNKMDKKPESELKFKSLLCVLWKRKAAYIDDESNESYLKLIVETKNSETAQHQAVDYALCYFEEVILNQTSSNHQDLWAAVITNPLLKLGVNADNLVKYGRKVAMHLSILVQCDDEFGKHIHKYVERINKISKEDMLSAIDADDLKANIEALYIPSPSPMEILSESPALTNNAKEEKEEMNNSNNETSNNEKTSIVNSDVDIQQETMDSTSNNDDNDKVAEEEDKERANNSNNAVPIQSETMSIVNSEVDIQQQTMDSTSNNDDNDKVAEEEDKERASNSNNTVPIQSETSNNETMSIVNSQPTMSEKANSTAISILDTILPKEGAEEAPSAEQHKKQDESPSHSRSSAIQSDPRLSPLSTERSSLQRTPPLNPQTYVEKSMHKYISLYKSNSATYLKIVGERVFGSNDYTTHNETHAFATLNGSTARNTGLCTVHMNVFAKIAKEKKFEKYIMHESSIMTYLSKRRAAYVPSCLLVGAADCVLWKRGIIGVEWKSIDTFDCPSLYKTDSTYGHLIGVALFRCLFSNFYIHGVVHANLLPQNILLASKPTHDEMHTIEVQLVDFTLTSKLDFNENEYTWLDAEKDWFNRDHLIYICTKSITIDDREFNHDIYTMALIYIKYCVNDGKSFE